MTTLPIRLDRDDTMAILDRLAAANPDYVYAPPGYESNDDNHYFPDSCVYFDPESGAPSCIIGHVLAEKGVTLTDLGRDLNAETAVSELPDRGIIDLDGDEYLLSALVRVQGAQDRGVCWWDAVGVAHNELDRTVARSQFYCSCDGCNPAT